MDPSVRCPERRRLNGAGVDSVFSFLRPTLAAGWCRVRLICLKGFEEEASLSRDHTAPPVISHRLHSVEPLPSPRPGLFPTPAAHCRAHFQSRRLHKNARRDHVRRSWVGYGSSEEPPPPHLCPVPTPYFSRHQTDEKGVCVWS